MSDTNLLSDDNTNHSSFAPVIASTPVADLEQHHKDGFVGVRFNPGLWPKLEAGAERPTERRRSRRLSASSDRSESGVIAVVLGAADLGTDPPAGA